MRKIKKVFQILFSHLDVLVLFKCLYHFLGFAMYSFLSNVLNLSMKSANLEYFTNENMIRLFQSPLSLFLILFIMCILCLYVAIHYIALTVYFTFHNQNVSFISFMKEIFNKSKHIWKPSNKGILLLIFLFFLLQYLSSGSIIFSSVIPEFIMQFMVENKLLLFLYIGLFIFLFIIFVIYAPTLYTFFIENKSFKKARMESRQEIRHSFWKKFFQILLYSVAFWLLFYGIYVCIVCLVFFVFRYGVRDLTPFWFIFKRMSSIYHVLSPIFLMACPLFLRYLLFLPDEGVDRRKEKKKKAPFPQIIKILFLLLLLVVFVEFADPSLYNQTEDSSIAVISHRGGGIFAPENTLAGIQEAIYNGSDYAEVDVQITKDGVLVLSHDSSLKRIAGISREISSFTYEELSKIDVGSPYSPHFKGERIPTLEEVLKAAKNKIKLVIELKKTENTEEVVKKTLQLIDENQMENECVIASLQLDIIKKVKQSNPSIQTAYLAAFAYGDLLSIQKYVDIYALEPSYVDEQLFHVLKGMNKKVFVWTINKEKSIYRMLHFPIDGIVTDNPYWTHYVIETYGQSLSEQLWVDAFHS